MELLVRIELLATVEGDQGAVAVLDLDLLDAADLDPGDPDVVALDQTRGVGEDGLVVLRLLEGDVADEDHQHAGGQARDDDEDDQLDEVTARLLVQDAQFTLTSVPVIAGRKSSVATSDMSVAGTAQHRCGERVDQVLLLGGAAGYDAEVRLLTLTEAGRGALVVTLAEAVHTVVDVRELPALGVVRDRRVRQSGTAGAVGRAVDLLVGAGVPARLLRQEPQVDVEDEAAEGLAELGGLLDDAFEQAGELGGVAREQSEDRLAELAEPDDVVAVVVQERGGRVGERRRVVEELLQRRLLAAQRVAGLHGVAQGRGQLRGDVGVEVGDLGQQLDVRDQRRQLGIHLLQVAVEGLDALAELVPSALEGGGQGVERVVQLGGLHRPEQRDRGR